MPIKKCHSLVVADKVLKAVNRKIKIELSKDCNVQCFDNCREQGYVIVKHSKRPSYVAFSENRNSDNIIIYVYSQVSFPSNLPDVNSWGDKKYFSYNEFSKAADYIIKRLAEEII